ncbi:hypothetical protein GCM10010978_30790 [Compostibacillus humi]|uniref:Uncharacterized protein n=1 Tax=Compostibacillus humi TaxID=1245525 RepID=A0A8J2XGL5_9BACI|nr:hypothetical protein GCM10010978_30790 [Compostibacillus humi]
MPDFTYWSQRKIKNQVREILLDFFGVPGMGADYRVKVPNSEGSSSCSLRQGHGGDRQV